MLKKINNSKEELFPNDLEQIYFGMGCFWGAEKVFWSINGVYKTAVGYAGGETDNPTYEEVCRGITNHAEVVKVVFDTKIVKSIDLLACFWENHDPTQGMRQGNDIGSQYRSIILTTNKNQKLAASKTLHKYETILLKHGLNRITTEIKDFKKFFYAEEYHQEYLKKNPRGYCGLGGTNIKFEF